MKKIILIFSFVPLLCVGQTEKFNKDFDTPRNVVEALIYAASSGDFQILGGLCDPNGEGDEHIKSVCQLAFSLEAGDDRTYMTRESFANTFKNAIMYNSQKINGALVSQKNVGEDGDVAEVGVSLGLDEARIIDLVNRDGTWYLSSFY